MKKIKLKPYQTIGLSMVVFILFLAGVFINQYNNHNNILKNPMYTIGTIVEISKEARSSDSFMYTYSYNGIVYKRGISVNTSENFKLNGKYYVIFEASKPKNGLILPFYTFNDSIQDTNKYWKETPAHLDLKEIENFMKNY